MKRILIGFTIMRAKIILFILSPYFLFINGYSQEDLQQKLLEAKNRVFPALVHVEPIKEIFSSGKKVKLKVTGSGVIFSSDGLILTNNHVAENASHVLCTLANREELTAEVIGLDALTDLAVLKLDLSRSNLKSVPYAILGDSDSIKVGQIVLALGSPLGLSRSLSMGVVSSIDRYFEDSDRMVSPFNLWIQTDAAINPGNSGGPMVSLDGKVIGINARAIFFGENLGFAIPINTAKLVIERILKDGRVKRSWIGIEWQEIKEFRKYKKDPNLSGVLVAAVDKKSPADEAGIKPGDLIYGVNNEKLNAVYQEELPIIRKFISELPVATKMTVNFIRDNKKMNVDLFTEKRGKFEGDEFECAEWGLSVKEITPQIAKNLNLKDMTGVLVSGVRMGSIAHEAEIFRGSVIRFIDTIKIIDLDHYKSLYQNVKKLPERGRMLTLNTRNSTYFALLKEN
jgi:serine protease Do